MKITKNKDHILLKNINGEYHLSLQEFNQLGELKAIKLAEKEIAKKLKSKVGKTISFLSAKRMGFCEYGIKDFCEKLDLDITKTYLVSELRSQLTIEVFLDYPNECEKIFQETPFTSVEILNFGEHNSKYSIEALRYVINKGVKSDRILRLFSCEVALSCLHNFENIYPDDKRPRLAIEARLLHLDGLISDNELNEACSAASYAASSASYSAANYAAYSASYSASCSAAHSSSCSAANSASCSAAHSASCSASCSASHSASCSAAYSASCSAAYSVFCSMLKNAITDEYEIYEMFLKISKED